MSIDLLPLGIAGLLSWGVWACRWLSSRMYRPVENDFRTSTSVVVPSFREDPDVLERCLLSWAAEGPTEIIVVPDVADHAVITMLRGHTEVRGLVVIPMVHAGKRSALGVGLRAARYEVVVLTDSDTEWQPGLLSAVQMPFADPQVGGVGTRQNVLERETSVWRRVADWLVNTRYLDYVPAQSRRGGVACLSGRTAAYRRAAVVPVLPRLEEEVFMGRRCVAGDDGRLTWLVLSSGYKTVYQSSARALSMFPDSLRAFVKQRVRWSRNSYRCYLTSIREGWLWQQPLVTQVTVGQILLTPLSMGITLAYVVLAWLAGAHWFLVVGWLLLGRVVRGASHLREHPRDLVLAPLMLATVTLIALPIKIYALFTMNTHGWLTRTATSVGGEGQSAASLIRVPEPRRASVHA